MGGCQVAMYPQAYDRILTEPPTIDADMRPSDIADTLRRLKFGPGHAQTVRVADAEVRDFLVAAVTRQGIARIRSKVPLGGR